MNNKYIMDVLLAIQTDIVAKNLEGAFGRCAVMWQMLEDENKLDNRGERLSDKE